MSTFFAWVWFLGLVVVGVLLLVEKWQREKQVSKLSEEKDRFAYERGQLASKVTQLSQYQGKFMVEYAKVINKFTLEFSNEYCSKTGEILWPELVKFNSGKKSK